MSRLTVTKQAGISAAIALFLSAPVMAQENNTDNVWEKYDFHLTVIGQEAPSAKDEDKYHGEAMVSTSTTTPGLLFICLNKRLRVSAALKPQDLRKNYRKPSRKVSYKYVDMTLDGGEKIPLERWGYAKDHKIIRSSRRMPAAKLYNAVIRNQQVTLFVGGKKPITLALPKPNRAFAEFGAECGLGKFAKKK